MKQIPGFDGYCATEDGRIVSVREAEPKLLKARTREGYLFVTVAVYRCGRRQRHRMAVHRLVLLAFKGLPLAAAGIGRHMNGNSLDNRAANLQWGTHSDNAQDAVRHGTLGPGMKAHRRKLDESQVKEIVRRLQSGERSPAIAREFGVSDYYPAQIARGRNWSYLGLQQGLAS